MFKAIRKFLDRLFWKRKCKHCENLYSISNWSACYLCYHGDKFEPVSTYIERLEE